MSASDFSEITFSGSSANADPVEAVREALSSVARQLFAAGGAPFHLTGMCFTAPDPAIYDLRLHALDLCYREVFAGFRPPIGTGKSAGPLRVEATARIPRTVPSTAVWHELSPPEVAREYSPRGQVSDMGALFAQWTKDGTAFRNGRDGLDIAYGVSAYEKLDLFLPDGAGKPPLWVFIHGGYWQASDKAQHAQFAAGMLGAGYAVANLNYGLCPDVALADIVRQIRAAMNFLAGNADDLGFDAGAIHVAGHSAGGHLAAMAAVDPAMPPLRSALLLSGLFELEPLSFLPVGRILGLSSPAVVAQLSPMRSKPRTGLRIRVALGALESNEFKWQSATLAREWGLPPPLLVRGANHFSLLDGLIDGALLEAAKEIAA